MMKTFLEFLKESKNTGNYVSVDTVLDQGGIKLPSGKFTKSAHVTLMYSEDSSIPFSDIQTVLEEYKDEFEATFKSVEMFDDQDDENLTAVVMTLNSDTLYEIHNKLVDIGLTHSYDYQPHLTFAYGVKKTDADELIEKIIEKYKNSTFKLSGFNNEHIIKDWAK